MCRPGGECTPDRAGLNITQRGEGILLVDAGELTGDDPNRVRYWWLTETEPGVWSHALSGEQGRLDEVLQSIAAVYASSPDEPPSPNETTTGEGRGPRP